MIKSRMIRKPGFDQTHPSRFTGMWPGASPLSVYTVINYNDDDADGTTAQTISDDDATQTTYIQ